MHSFLIADVTLQARQVFKNSLQLSYNKRNDSSNNYSNLDFKALLTFDFL